MHDKSARLGVSNKMVKSNDFSIGQENMQYLL